MSALPRLSYTVLLTPILHQCLLCVARSNPFSRALAHLRSLSPVLPISSSSLQRKVDEKGKVISQLCDENNNFGSIQFEQAMRKQASRAELWGVEGNFRGVKCGAQSHLKISLSRIGI